jgi:acetylornithine deacetylase/succinyl-diaminopimelate desuccinylase-like protein
VDHLNLSDNVTIKLDLINSSEPYELNPNEKIVRSLNKAHKTVAGKELPLGGVKFVGEAGLFINQAGVPTVYHGVDGRTIHSDEELVEVDVIVRLVKVYVHTVFNFFGQSNK